MALEKLISAMTLHSAQDPSSTPAQESSLITSAGPPFPSPSGDSVGQTDNENGVTGRINTVYEEKYRVVSELAKGKFGDTFLVEDRTRGTVVVAKLPTREDVREDTTGHEIEALSALAHPNIVQLIDVGIHGLQRVIVTEYCPGGTLHSAIYRQYYTPCPDWGQRVPSYCKQLVEAVSYMHGKNFVHLDIKPSNIILDAEEQIVKLIDFGMSLRMSNVYATETARTRGTVFYMAPELMGRKKGPLAWGKADVYSLGCVFFALCTAVPPFYDPKVKTFEQLYIYYPRCCARGRPTPSFLPNTFSPQQKCSLQKLLERMLDPDPSSRVTIWDIGEV